MRISDWSSDVCSSDLLRRLEAARIEHVVTSQRHADGKVELHVALTLFAQDPAVVPVHFDLSGQRIRLDCGIGAGETVVHHVFEIDDPKLWWPAVSGEQHLYRLTVDLPAECVPRHIGLSTLALITHHVSRSPQPTSVL